MLISAVVKFQKGEDQGDVSPKKLLDVGFDVKLGTSAKSTVTKKHVMGSAKYSAELSPIHARGITTYGGQGFDQSYLDP